MRAIALRQSVVGYWRGGFDEAALQAWAEELRGHLTEASVTLGIVFMTPDFFPEAKAALELLRVHAQIPLLVGCSTNSLIANREEIEDTSGLVLGLYHLPGAKLTPFYFRQEQLEEGNGPAYWHAESGVNPEETNGWLVFMDPFHLEGEGWLQSWNEAYAPLPIVGGLASGPATEQRTQIYFNDQVLEEGGVAVSIGGDIKLLSVISQGCTPIGDIWTITRTDRNLIHQIANRPAYEVLVSTFNNLTPDEQKKTRGNLFVGLVVNEYLDDFHRGDFLIRNLLGADPKSGVLAVGAFPRPGQTIQFQRRDAAAASEDMTALLERTCRELGTTPIYGGCLCICNGRGQRMFGEPSHDAAFIQKYLGPLPLAGFFCNGEIGPVGNRNFLHGYTASLALFVKK